MATVGAWTAARRARKAKAAETIKANAEAAKAELKASKEASLAGFVPVEKPSEFLEAPEDTGEPESEGQEDGHTGDEGQGTTPEPESTEE